MGLRDEIQQDIAEAFDTDLADAVKPFTLHHYERGGYNVSSGSVTSPAESTTESRGVFDSYINYEIFNSAIEPTDIRLIVLMNELLITPRVGDKILESAHTYRIIFVEQDPADASYILTIRNPESP
jgi:hypothetical protein